jgi:hypothetical protein
VNYLTQFEAGEWLGHLKTAIREFSDIEERRRPTKKELTELLYNVLNTMPTDPWNADQDDRLQIVECDLRVHYTFTGLWLREVRRISAWFKVALEYDDWARARDENTAELNEVGAKQGWYVVHVLRALGHTPDVYKYDDATLGRHFWAKASEGHNTYDPISKWKRLDHIQGNLDNVNKVIRTQGLNYDRHTRREKLEQGKAELLDKISRRVVA